MYRNEISERNNQDPCPIYGFPVLASSKIDRRTALKLGIAAGIATGLFLDNPSVARANQKPFKYYVPGQSLLQTDPAKIPNVTTPGETGLLLVTHDPKTNKGGMELVVNEALYSYLESIRIPREYPSVAIVDQFPIGDTRLQLQIAAVKRKVLFGDPVFGIQTAIGQVDNGYYHILPSRPLNLDEARGLNFIQVGWENHDTSRLPGPAIMYGTGLDYDGQDINLFPLRPIISAGGVYPPR